MLFWGCFVFGDVYDRATASTTICQLSLDHPHFILNDELLLRP